MADEGTPYRIAGRKFIQALLDSGIVRRGDFVRRVIIDAHADNVVILYVERIGDSRLLNLVSTLEGVEIREEPRGDG